NGIELLASRRQSERDIRSEAMTRWIHIAVGNSVGVVIYHRVSTGERLPGENRRRGQTWIIAWATSGIRRTGKDVGGASRLHFSRITRADVTRRQGITRCQFGDAQRRDLTIFC